MNDNPAELASPVDYKGHQIVLASYQQNDNTWVCEYFVSDAGNPHEVSNAVRADGNFPSREAAELAAVQKAKASIDLY